MNEIEPFSVGQLLAQVGQRSGVRLGLVVHVGAGPAALEDHAQTRAERLVLVEGDPDTAAELQEAARARQPVVEVIAQAVAAAAGPLQWRRYNLSQLNGPLDFGSLQSIYPRLRENVSLERMATAFDALLLRLNTQRRPGAENVLLLDVPGQEHSLFNSIESSVVHTFDWVILRGCRQAQCDGWAPIDMTRDWLSRAYYTLVDADDAGQGLWPWSLHRFDPDAQQRDEAERQLAAAQSRSRELEKEVSALKAEAESFARALTAAKSATAELQVKVETLTRERAQLAAERDALARESAGLHAARDEQSRAARDARERVVELDAELLDTGARYGLLQEELVKAEAQIELIADLLLRDPKR